MNTPPAVSSHARAGSTLRAATASTSATNTTARSSEATSPTPIINHGNKDRNNVIASRGEKRMSSEEQSGSNKRTRMDIDFPAIAGLETGHIQRLHDELGKKHLPKFRAPYENLFADVMQETGRFFTDSLQAAEKQWEAQKNSLETRLIQAQEELVSTKEKLEKEKTRRRTKQTELKNAKTAMKGLARSEKQLNQDLNAAGEESKRLRDENNRLRNENMQLQSEMISITNKDDTEFETDDDDDTDSSSMIRIISLHTQQRRPNEILANGSTTPGRAAAAPKMPEKSKPFHEAILQRWGPKYIEDLRKHSVILPEPAPHGFMKKLAEIAKKYSQVEFLSTCQKLWPAERPESHYEKAFSDNEIKKVLKDLDHNQEVIPPPSSTEPPRGRGRRASISNPTSARAKSTRSQSRKRL